MLNVIMLNVILLNIIMLNVIMLNVVSPEKISFSFKMVFVLKVFQFVNLKRQPFMD
jgi:hypothetical protein